MDSKRVHPAAEEQSKRHQRHSAESVQGLGRKGFLARAGNWGRDMGPPLWARDKETVHAVEASAVSHCPELSHRTAGGKTHGNDLLGPRQHPVGRLSGVRPDGQQRSVHQRPPEPQKGYSGQTAGQWWQWHHNSSWQYTPSCVKGCEWRTREVGIVGRDAFCWTVLGWRGKLWRLWRLTVHMC